MDQESCPTAACVIRSDLSTLPKGLHSILKRSGLITRGSVVAQL